MPRAGSNFALQAGVFYVHFDVKMDENHHRACGQFSLLRKALHAIVNWPLGNPGFL